MNDKLDKILHFVENLTLKIDKLEKTILNYGERLDELEGFLTRNLKKLIFVKKIKQKQVN